MDENDLHQLRRCVDLARDALDAGEEPFGSVLVAAFGSMLLQLNAIRAATERQAELFAQLLDGKKKRDAAVEA